MIPALHLLFRFLSLSPYHSTQLSELLTGSDEDSSAVSGILQLRLAARWCRHLVDVSSSLPYSWRRAASLFSGTRELFAQYGFRDSFGIPQSQMQLFRMCQAFRLTWQVSTYVMRLQSTMFEEFHFVMSHLEEEVRSFGQANHLVATPALRNYVINVAVLAKQAWYDSQRFHPCILPGRREEVVPPYHPDLQFVMMGLSVECWALAGICGALSDRSWAQVPMWPSDLVMHLA